MILGILHHLTVHHDESLVQVWIIDRELLKRTAEEEGGDDDIDHEERDDKKNEQKNIRKTKVVPDPQDQITDRADSDVDPSELLTEADSVVFTTTTTTNIKSGESKESYSWEDKEGGMSVEDLQ